MFWALAVKLIPFLDILLRMQVQNYEMFFFFKSSAMHVEIGVYNFFI